MFNGVPDQFHQFGPSLPFPLSFPLHHHGANISPAIAATSTPNFPAGCFDLYHPTVLQNHVLQLQQQQQQLCTIRKEKEEESGSDDILSTNMVVVGVDSDERSMSDQYPWSNDEVLALLKIRSGLENWVSEFTWEHVSRKLAELGYQRSAEKCKEKFEEESRQFNDMSYNRFFSEQNELYHAEIPIITTEKNNPDSLEQNGGEGKQEEDEEEEKKNCDSEADAAGKLAPPAAANPFEENNEEVEKPMKKRKRKKSEDEFEIFMGFCASVVKRLIAKQEEMHNKLIEDIVKREDACIAREEAWRRQEISKIKKEIELRAQEKVSAAEKQAKVMDLLKKIVPFDSVEDQSLLKRIEDLFMSTQASNSTTSSNLVAYVPNTIIKNSTNNPNLPTSASCKSPSVPQIEGSPHVGINAHGTTSSQKTEEVHDIVPFVSAEDKDGTGKRWPRDEVLALINIRCKLNNNNINIEDKELAAAAKQGPLWERISKGMMEMGHKRSAKRCKEKWENINKYFRKTKDNKKKRSQDSRTCPYFQQLNSLYSQGSTTLPPPHSDDAPENC